MQRPNSDWITASCGSEANCVQVRFAGDEVQLRSSAEPGHTVLSFNRAEWEAFLAGVKNGEFNVAI